MLIMIGSDEEHTKERQRKYDETFVYSGIGSHVLVRGQADVVGFCS
jgi:hypothetical protein